MIMIGLSFSVFGNNNKEKESCNVCYLCMIVVIMVFCVVFFFFKQKTAYEIVSRDWSSDVCSSDLG